MPVTVTCPSCGTQGHVSRRRIGQTIRCAHCGTHIVVQRPAEPTAAPAPSPAAPVPVPCPGCKQMLAVRPSELHLTVACGQCGTHFVPATGQPVSPSNESPAEKTFDFAEEEPPAGQLPPEPWYYRFLTILTYVNLWANLAFVALGLVGWLIWVLVSLIAAARAESAVGFLALCAMTLPYLGLLLAWLVVTLTVVGWSFLFLDAARNLRALRYRGGSR